jgi:glycosyltransferase involved in cell wall biosynthesis
MTTSPRVLVLASVLGQGVGGVQRHNQELLPRVAKRLAENGGSLSLLEGTQRINFELPDSIVRIPSKVAPRPVLRRALAEGHALRHLLEQRAQEGNPFQLVHTAHQPVPRGFDTPLTVLIHDLRALRGAHTPFSRRLLAKEVLGRSARRAACILTVSESMADEIALAMHIPRNEIEVIPNGGDHFTPLKRCSTNGAPLLCVGHLEPRKHQELLLMALAEDDTLPKAQFVGASKGKELERLQALAKKLGVQERVEFLGALEDDSLQRLYAQASCVVLPSSLEGFGIVALEALRARVPLAVSSIPAHVEVTAGKVPQFANDARDCARAIRAALQLSPARMEELALEVERYSWERSAQRLVQVWTKAAAFSLPR